VKIIFAILGVLALLASLGTCATAKSSLHETVGVALLLVAVLAIGFAAILDQLQRNNKDVLEQFFHLAQFLKERLK
jgi:hypothetical protein